MKFRRCIKKKWRVMSTCPEHLALMASFSEVPDLPADRFIECKGKIAQASANYPPRMAELFWSLIASTRDPHHDDLKIGQPLPDVSCMITRKISLKSPEARSEKALKAIEKELQGHQKRGTWSEVEVREYKK